ncbi:unnamed protein product [Adineta steineri]|uniref:Uncharacterized protein n=1 Tax=Adineta steineri TaxID=433720 RepID=A0A814QC63_9BILA|nr:unnamed protein product [Adineta steineri]CAF1117513.1 unnamed protein product [Adineta steineri]CAF3788498.1 unnamed protein product [Adineta steineri]CAF4156042.1 unnamed protein product [Adineta steineri]
MEAPHITVPRAVAVEHKAPICGGPTEARELSEQDKAFFEEFRDIIEQKLREQFDIPKDYKIEPAKVQSQVVCGSNHYFHVRLPNAKFAHVKVFQPLKVYELQHTDRSARVNVEKETHDD